MLRDDINNAVKDAMRAKDERKLSTLRMVNSTIKNADIAARGEGKPPLSDADLLGVFCILYVGQYEPVVLAYVGIHIILAVSLTLVNGSTGQFSMGHIGFMAVGAYSSAWLSTVILPRIEIWNQWIATPVLGETLFFALTIFGGLVSAAIGIVVGIPSLRLRGDYLAIVTLGFGEIIRILILNIDDVGGARGLIGIPKLGNIGWIFAWACLTCLFCFRM